MPKGEVVKAALAALGGLDPVINWNAGKSVRSFAAARHVKQSYGESI